MARGNSNRQTFASMLAELKAEAVKLPEIEVKQERRYYLIVTEGARTEPIYFKYLASRLPKKLIDTIDVNGQGANTVSVVKAAIRLRAERLKNLQLPPYDEVWAVYDKDDFPAKNYHKAIKMASDNNIHSGHSNQSFELWYVLHFQFLDAAIHRSDYIDILTKQLGFKYEKNSEQVVRMLFDKKVMRRAIVWAKRLEALHEGKTAARSCPMTMVYQLVENLLNYMEANPTTEEAIVEATS
jgi:hypothetical protein